MRDITQEVVSIIVQTVRVHIMGASQETADTSNTKKSTNSGGAEKNDQIFEIVKDQRLMLRKIENLSNGYRYKGEIIAISAQSVLIKINNSIAIEVNRTQILLQGASDLQTGQSIGMSYDHGEGVLSIDNHRHIGAEDRSMGRDL